MQVARAARISRSFLFRVIDELGQFLIPISHNDKTINTVIYLNGIVGGTEIGLVGMRVWRVLDELLKRGIITLLG